MTLRMKYMSLQDSADFRDARTRSLLAVAPIVSSGIVRRAEPNIRDSSSLPGGKLSLTCQLELEVQ